MKRRFVIRSLWTAPVAALALTALPAFAQEAAEPAEPEVAETFETTTVAMETTAGTIVLVLETERAPVTSANFLKYADEGRFDGTVFYRTMRLDWGDKVAGLIQGGTQYDPKRILPPIAHEPTSKTGLSHTEGAISMARYEPGSATGDFSIMATDMTGLDAKPDSDNPDQQSGFAVFGHVVEGMDVVKAIHAAPTDPDKGEGFLKGQMLADPIKIVSVKRVAE
ncbi:peptidylprolyl isomerase [Croceicoccus gelatinilyticus]|uniref:peptidylprolyl isomerase n=1 Tax=Croceicoccus gelatinilyticus TaxID=2835536 RepID=UPI001BCDCCCF|nr:peptidylprolyl isomerase [Croceicoccus gelatinilyticus]MBS7670470.1 peptidylprolyl isomerase [Croceicoccus gelatinilyticus]